MSARTLTLALWPRAMVRLACQHCRRKGQYRKLSLIDQFGGDISMPELRQRLADCPRCNEPDKSCGAYFSDLAKPT